MHMHTEQVILRVGVTVRLITVYTDQSYYFVYRAAGIDLVSHIIILWSREQMHSLVAHCQSIKRMAIHCENEHGLIIFKRRCM